MEKHLLILIALLLFSIGVILLTLSLGIFGIEPSTDNYFSRHKDTISAVGVLATLLVAVVSLWIATKPPETILKPVARIIRLFGDNVPEEKRQQRYLSVYVENKGTLPASIPLFFLHWKIPFSKDLLKMAPLDDFAIQKPPGTEFIPRRKYPVHIENYQSSQFIVGEMGVVRKIMINELKKYRFLRIRAFFISAYIQTENGNVFDINLEKTLKKEIRRWAKQP